jgi:putative phage-type endonuclease
VTEVELRRRVMPSAYRIAPPPDDPASEPHPELRRQGIGGSDIAAIVGFGEYGKTALHVYLEKTGQGDGYRPPHLEEAARFGHLLESVIAEEFSARSGLRLLPAPGMLASERHPWALANLDRLVTDRTGAGRIPLADKYPLELKTRSAYQSASWRDEPTDAPTIQLQWYLGVTGASKGYLAALIGGNRLKWYEVQRDDELIGILITAAQEFRQMLADNTPPEPDGSPQTTSLLDSIWAGDPESFLFLSDGEAAQVRYLRTEITALTETLSVAGERLNAAKNKIKVLMGESEVAVAGTEIMATWRRNGTFRSKEFAESEPELAAEYQLLRPAVDTKRLRDELPETYRQYRARRFSLTGSDEE